MNKILVFIISIFIALSFAQVDQNYIGNGDTSAVWGTGTATVYSKKMRLSAYENSIFEVYTKDTANDAAAVTSQVLKFVWGIEYIHPTWQSTTVLPKYKYWGRVTIDTLSTLTAGNFIYAPPLMDSLGMTPIVRKYVDTTTISGYVSQARPYLPFWDVYFRFFATGLPGTQDTTGVKFIFQQHRRKAYKIAN
jgi:hypothetical protein